MTEIYGFARNSRAIAKTRNEIMDSINSLLAKHDQETLDNRVYVLVDIKGNIVGLDTSGLNGGISNMSPGNSICKIAFGEVSMFNWTMMKIK